MKKLEAFKANNTNLCIKQLSRVKGGASNGRPGDRALINIRGIGSVKA